MTDLSVFGQILSIVSREDSPYLCAIRFAHETGIPFESVPGLSEEKD